MLIVWSFMQICSHIRGRSGSDSAWKSLRPFVPDVNCQLSRRSRSSLRNDESPGRWRITLLARARTFDKTSSYSAERRASTDSPSPADPIAGRILAVFFEGRARTLGRITVFPTIVARFATGINGTRECILIMRERTIEELMTSQESRVSVEKLPRFFHHLHFD